MRSSNHNLDILHLAGTSSSEAGKEIAAETEEWTMISGVLFSQTIEPAASVIHGMTLMVASAPSEAMPGKWAEAATN